VEAAWSFGEWVGLDSIFDIYSVLVSIPFYGLYTGIIMWSPLFNSTLSENVLNIN